MTVGGGLCGVSGEPQGLWSNAWKPWFLPQVGVEAALQKTHSGSGGSLVPSTPPAAEQVRVAQVSLVRRKTTRRLC